MHTILTYQLQIAQFSSTTTAQPQSCDQKCTKLACHPAFVALWRSCLSGSATAIGRSCRRTSGTAWGLDEMIFIARRSGRENKAWLLGRRSLRNSRCPSRPLAGAGVGDVLQPRDGEVEGVDLLHSFMDIGLQGVDGGGKWLHGGKLGGKVGVVQYYFSELLANLVGEISEGLARFGVALV